MPTYHMLSSHSLVTCVAQLIFDRSPETQPNLSPRSSQEFQSITISHEDIQLSETLV